MRLVEPRRSLRGPFGRWARTVGAKPQNTRLWLVPDGVEIPRPLIEGGKIDGQPYVVPAPVYADTYGKADERTPFERAAGLEHDEDDGPTPFDDDYEDES